MGSGGGGGGGGERGERGEVSLSWLFTSLLLLFLQKCLVLKKITQAWFRGCTLYMPNLTEKV